MTRQDAEAVVGRRTRSDAQRNRERILEVARGVFERAGAGASMDEIAREAEVGSGTLYRHFPTRDALIEAVYRSGVEKLAAAAGQFSETMEPVEALKSWLLLFVDHIAAKLIIVPALNSIVGGMERLYAGSRGQLGEAMEMLLKRAIQSGKIRADIEPQDLLRVLIGVAQTAPSPGWERSARRMVEIMIAGSRVEK